MPTVPDRALQKGTVRKSPMNPDASLTIDGRVVVNANTLERLERIEQAARVVVEQRRWDLAEQPDIRALLEALER